MNALCKLLSPIIHYEKFCWTFLLSLSYMSIYVKFVLPTLNSEMLLNGDFPISLPFCKVITMVPIKITLVPLNSFLVSLNLVIVLLPIIWLSKCLLGLNWSLFCLNRLWLLQMVHDCSKCKEIDKLAEFKVFLKKYLIRCSNK